MKRILLLLVVVGFSAMFFTSCISTNKGFQSSPVIARNVDLDPIKADIWVNDTVKLVGHSSSTYFLMFRVSGDKTMADGINYSSDMSGSTLSQFNPIRILRIAKLNNVRASAAYNALSKGDYDLMVHPNYTMTTKNYLGIVKIYECSVTGYGAKYYNFRTEKQKVIILESGQEFVFPECE